MAEITAGLVKDLRSRSGAGMMDCKKALVETGGDIEAAVDWLRTKGLAAAAKKAGRVAAEGLVGLAVSGGAGAIVEVNSETDFVARNADFQSFVKTAAELALANDGDLETILKSGYPGTDRTVEGEITQLIAGIGENIQFRRSAALSVEPGIVASYVHNAVAPNLGKIGVLVGLASSADPASLETLGKQLAMHIAATGPQAVGVDDLDSQLVAHERELLTQQARQSGRPDHVIEKMVEGRLRKFFEDAVLTCQTWVIDGETRVSGVLEKAAADLGTEISVSGFVRFRLGEGIERDDGDFAAEVAATAGSSA